MLFSGNADSLEAKVDGIKSRLLGRKGHVQCGRR